MQEITKKIRDKALKEFHPMIEQMAADGMGQEDIVKFFKAHCDLKIKNYYLPRMNQLSRVISDMKLEGKEPDSKAEAIFYKELQDSGIKFKFHYPIGNYTADYLINDTIVFELDGAQHNPDRDERRDKYLRRMGYKVVRVPIWILEQDVKAVVDTIKELSK
jgi:very-short-patch-repair endonuclease